MDQKVSKLQTRVVFGFFCHKRIAQLLFEPKMVLSQLLRAAYTAINTIPKRNKVAMAKNALETN